MASSEVHPCSRLKIILLGGFAVYIDGQILSDTAINGRKARSLLKLVAHQRQYQMVRDHAVDILWPDLDPDAANAQLYKAIHHIRKAFGKYCKEAAHWIRITDDLIRMIPPGGLLTDMELFTKAARKGLKHKKTAELEKALSYYTGEFLPMDRYSEWASFPREHYRQLYLDVLTSLAEVYEKQEDLSEAAEIMRLALDKEPTLETAHCGLMGVFGKKGQPTRSFHQYEVCRQLLRDELGMSPSPNTRKILDDVAEENLQGKNEPNSSRTSVSSSPIPFVGRTEACAAIEQRIEGLKGGLGASLLISGEAGIGKTRLVQELMQRAQKKQLPFFKGHSSAGGGNMVYGPFVELFKDILNHQPGMKDMLPFELGCLIPGFSEKSQALPHADKLSAKGYLFAELHRFLCQLTLEGPAVIILEDLHAADHGSKELLAYLIQHRGRLPILFVVTFRKEKGEPLPNFLFDLQAHFAEELELTPFTYEEHVKLLQLHAHNATISTDTERHIFQLAEGNPFFALELLMHNWENGKNALSKPLQGKEILTSTIGSKKVPPAISHMLEERLEKRSPAARHLLYISAIIGRQVPYKILSSIWNSENVDRPFNALEEVISARFLEEQGLDYSFRNALVQKTIYSLICEARRQKLHLKVAERILELSPGTDETPVELIAWHYLGAKDWMKAAHYLIVAGKHAENIDAHEDALQRYQEAYDVLNRENAQQVPINEVGPAVKLKGEILERIGDAHRAWGQAGKSYEAYREAIFLAEKAPSKNQKLMELHRKMAVAAIFRKKNDISKKHLDKAFGLLAKDPVSEARLLITKALYLWHVNELDEAYAVAQKAFQQAKNSGFEGIKSYFAVFPKPLPSINFMITLQ